MPDLVTALLLAAVLVLLVAILAVVVTRRPGAVDARELSATVASSIHSSGVLQQIGRVEELAREMTAAGNEVRNLFRLRPERGAAGEFQLEELLADLVPPDRYVIRGNIPQVGTPDAAVKTRGGVVLIDAKFPLDAYRAMQEARGAPEAAAAGRRFRQAVMGHVDAVAERYVRPDAGTLPFAVLFVPSEAVFAAALDADPLVLRNANERGVLLASPSTLSAHLAILAAGVRAERLGDAAAEIQRTLRALGDAFQGLRAEWETLLRHVGNANAKASDVGRRLDALERAWGEAARLGARADPPDRDNN